MHMSYDVKGTGKYVVTLSLYIMFFFVNAVMYEIHDRAPAPNPLSCLFVCLVLNDASTLVGH